MILIKKFKICYKKFLKEIIKNKCEKEINIKLGCYISKNINEKLIYIQCYIK